MKVFQIKAVSADSVEGIEYQLNNFLSEYAVEAVSISHSSVYVRKEFEEDGRIYYSAVMIYANSEE